MLLAHGKTAFGRAQFRWGFVFGRGIWVKLIDQVGLAFDTRFLPAASGSPKQQVCLYLVVRGRLETHGPNGTSMDAPVAYAMTLEQLEGAEDRRPFTFRATGDPCIVIEVHVAAADVRQRFSLPRRIVLPSAVWECARRSSDLAKGDHEVIVGAVGELLRALAADGWIEATAVAKATTPPPRIVHDIWQGLQPLIENFVLNTTTSDIAGGAGLTSRQAERGIRYLIQTVGLIGSGLRSLTNRLRTKVAVVFLSAEGVTVGDVAHLVGYASADAMARAFRDAGLPAPSVVQRSVAILGAVAFSE